MLQKGFKVTASFLQYGKKIQIYDTGLYNIKMLMLMRREYLRSSNTYTFTEAEAKHCLQNKTKQNTGLTSFTQLAILLQGLWLCRNRREQLLKAGLLLFYPLIMP